MHSAEEMHLPLNISQYQSSGISEMTNKAPKIPRFITAQFAGGAQEFRVNHRHALREALKALRNARLGCAYSPAFKAIQRANAAIDEAIEAARPGNWERCKSRAPDPNAIPHVQGEAHEK